MTPGAIEILARASSFTPRVANRLLKRARDYIQVKRKDDDRRGGSQADDGDDGCR